MPKTRRFIDPKKAVKFVLVPRSRSDVLSYDTDAPSHTLQLVEDNRRSKTNDLIENIDDLFSDDEDEILSKYIVDADDGNNENSELVLVPERLNPANQKKVVKKKGYDYKQHLKPTGAPGAVFISKNGVVTVNGEPDKPDFSKGLNLDPKLFPWISKEAEEEAKLHNKMTLMNPDEVLDEEIDYILNLEDDDYFNNEENQLEDDFVIKANYDSENEVNITLKDFSEDDEYFESDDIDVDSDLEDDFNKLSLNEKKDEVVYKDFDKDIIIKRGRPAHSLLLEENFEYVLQQYNNDEYNEEATQGKVSIEEFDDIIDEFLSGEKKPYIQNEALKKYQQKYPPKKSSIDDDLIINDDDLDYSTDSEELEVIYGREKDPKPEWDCETILTTYTNTENHPSLIESERSDKKNKPKKTQPKVDKEETSIEEKPEIKVNQGEARKKGETLEEKKLRKLKMKEMRKERRQQKKSLKQQYRKEQILRNKSKNASHGVSIIQM